MIEKLIQSLHESIKQRNTPDAFVVDMPSDANVIHRGYIRNSTYPLRYDFVPKEKAKSKNEGDHVYKFGAVNSGGVIHIEHKINSNLESGHETTSIIKTEITGVEKNIGLMRTVIPAVMHHIKSHKPDIIKLDKSFKFKKILLKRIDPSNNKYTVTQGKNETIIKIKTPLDDKSKRIISHIKSKLKINTNKE